MWVDGIAAEVNENFLMADLADVWDKAPQLMDGPISLSYFAHRRIDLLK